MRWIGITPCWSTCTGWRMRLTARRALRSSMPRWAGSSKSIQEQTSTPCFPRRHRNFHGTMEPVGQLRLRGIAIKGGWGPGDYNSLADLVLETADLDRLRALVQADNAEGFLVFYSLVAPADYPIPLHCIRWIVEYYDCLRTSENLAIEAFRGSLKTTVMTIYLTAYRIGCSPHLENLFAQGNHRAAVENAQTVASIVKDQPMFRLLFPHVSPDIDKGWGADGYQVMRTDLPYGEWRQMRTKTPTLVGAGYKDALVLGKHPRGHGILDDVNNYLNT